MSDRELGDMEYTDFRRGGGREIGSRLCQKFDARAVTGQYLAVGCDGSAGRINGDGSVEGERTQQAGGLRDIRKAGHCALANAIDTLAREAVRVVFTWLPSTTRRTVGSSAIEARLVAVLLTILTGRGIATDAVLAILGGAVCVFFTWLSVRAGRALGPTAVDTGLLPVFLMVVACGRGPLAEARVRTGVTLGGRVAVIAILPRAVVNAGALLTRIAGPVAAADQEQGAATAGATLLAGLPFCAAVRVARSVETVCDAGAGFPRFTDTVSTAALYRGPDAVSLEADIRLCASVAVIAALPLAVRLAAAGFAGFADSVSTAESAGDPLATASRTRIGLCAGVTIVTGAGDGIEEAAGLGLAGGSSAGVAVFALDR
jgi:hypothetical protein